MIINLNIYTLFREKFAIMDVLRCGFDDLEA
jgi:hypothetical protein